VPRDAYTIVAEEIVARTDKPVAVLTSLMSAVDPEEAAYVRSLGIAVLEGTANGLAAFRHVFEYRDLRRERTRR
jgi:hypothetical protein